MCFLTISRYICLIPFLLSLPVFVSEDILTKISDFLLMLFFYFHQQCLAALYVGTICDSALSPQVLSVTLFLKRKPRLYNYRVPNNQEVYHTMQSTFSVVSVLNICLLPSACNYLSALQDQVFS